MPARITASWRIRYAASPPNAGFRIGRRSCSISPGDTTSAPIILADKPTSRSVPLTTISISWLPDLEQTSRITPHCATAVGWRSTLS